MGIEFEFDQILTNQRPTDGERDMARALRNPNNHIAAHQSYVFTHSDVHKTGSYYFEQPLTPQQRKEYEDKGFTITDTGFIKDDAPVAAGVIHRPRGKQRIGVNRGLPVDIIT